MDDDRNFRNESAGNAPDDATSKQPASKAAAARINGKKSLGPKTAAGKSRSSQNAFKHGLYSKRLFPTLQQWEKEGAEYQAILSGLIEHYRPAGLYEDFLVERIASGFLRSARIISHEQQIFACGIPFETRSSNSLPRYQGAVERQLTKDTERLERAQAERKATEASLRENEVDQKMEAAQARDGEQAEAPVGIGEEFLASLAPPRPTAPSEPKAKSTETDPPAGDA